MAEGSDYGRFLLPRVLLIQYGKCGAIEDGDGEVRGVGKERFGKWNPENGLCKMERGPKDRDSLSCIRTVYLTREQQLHSNSTFSVLPERDK